MAPETGRIAGAAMRVGVADVGNLETVCLYIMRANYGRSSVQMTVMSESVHYIHIPEITNIECTYISTNHTG